MGRCMTQCLNHEPRQPGWGRYFRHEARFHELPRPIVRIDVNIVRVPRVPESEMRERSLTNPVNSRQIRARRRSIGLLARTGPAIFSRRRATTEPKCGFNH
jgi:hypothetical protein